MKEVWACVGGRVRVCFHCNCICCGCSSVTADLSANGQSYIFTWTAVDGITYFVSLNNETEVEGE